MASYFDEHSIKEDPHRRGGGGGASTSSSSSSSSSALNPDLSEFLDVGARTTTNAARRAAAAVEMGELSGSPEARDFRAVAELFQSFRAGGASIGIGNGNGLLDELIGRLMREGSGDDPLFAKKDPPASKFFVRNLPERRPGSSRDETCPICTEAFTDEDRGRVVPCRHVFHAGCIRPWLRVHHTCPMCRRGFPTDDPAFERVRKARMTREQLEDEGDEGDPLENSMFG